MLSTFRNWLPWVHLRSTEFCTICISVSSNLSFCSEHLISKFVAKPLNGTLFFLHPLSPRIPSLASFYNLHSLIVVHRHLILHVFSMQIWKHYLLSPGELNRRQLNLGTLSRWFTQDKLPFNIGKSFSLAFFLKSPARTIVPLDD